MGLRNIGLLYYLIRLMTNAFFKQGVEIFLMLITSEI